MKKNLIIVFVAIIWMSLSDLYANDWLEQDGNKTPSRVEEKKYAGITSVSVDQKYGNILVRESSSKEVEVQIQYFDTNGEKANCTIVSNNGVLAIATVFNKTSYNNNRPRIDYVLSVPQSMNLAVVQKYGNTTIGAFKSDLTGKTAFEIAYGNLTVETGMKSSPTIQIKYGKAVLQTVSDATLEGKYSNYTIAKAAKLSIEGKYCHYIFDKVNQINSVNDISYSTFKIGEVGRFNVAEIKYGDVTINKLNESLVTILAYSKLNVTGVSDKLEKVLIDAKYSDIILTLNSNISASFDTSFSYGDLKIDSKYSVAYTENTSERNKVKKVGKIGTKSPMAKIAITNSFANVQLK